jgi:hypothetical protein
MRTKLAFLLVLPAVVRTLHAQIVDQARSFVQHLYSGYTSSSYNPTVNHPSSTFTPGLVTLLQRDKEHTPPGETGSLDFDPICACQDPDGLKLTDLSIKEDGPQQATAFVTLQFGASSDRTSLQLNLLWAPSGWRIDDIASPECPSLRGPLAPATKKHP